MTSHQRSMFRHIFSLATAAWFSLIASPDARAQPFDPAPDTLKIMTWNVEWMFDDYQGDNRSQLSKEQSAPNGEYWDAKVSGVAGVIAGSQPNIVALQEIEGDQTLRDIAERLRSKHGQAYRYAFVQGTDTFTEQDVGFLVRSSDGTGLVSFSRFEQSKAMFDSNEYYNLSKHMVARFQWSDAASPLTIINVHLRARAEAEDKRVRQAKLARHWLEPSLAAGEDAIVLGDLNSEYKAGTVRGDIAAITTGTGGPMVDLLTLLNDPAAPTHLILDRQFDRILVSPSMMVDGPGKDWSFAGVEILDSAVIVGRKDGQEHWDNRLTMSPQELDLSDHHPVVAMFTLR